MTNQSTAEPLTLEEQLVNARIEREICQGMVTEMENRLKRVQELIAYWQTGVRTWDEQVNFIAAKIEEKTQ